MTAADIHIPAARRSKALRRNPYGVTTALSWAAIVLLFTISHLALTTLGISYESSGGAPYEKIAPGTYFAGLAFLALFIQRGNAMALIDEIIRRHLGTVLFSACWVMLFSYIYIYQGPPLTATFDTFLLPIMMFIVVPRLAPDAQRKMAVFLHIFMAVNAVLGVAEFVGGFRLTPIIAQGMVLNDEWRSSALLGHPLVNACMAGCYGVILLMGGGRDMPKGLVAPAFLLQCAGMAVFGGRLATVLFVGAIGIAFAYRALAVASGKRFSLGTAGIAAIALPLLLTALIVMGSEGFFDKFLMRFVQDEGSADSRVKMFELVSQIPFHQLLVGADPEFVATLQRLNGIPFGIESFEVGFVAYYGILISIPFFIGLFAFCVSISRATRRGSGWAVLFFMLICTGSASLSGKGTVFGLFVIMLVLMMRPLPRPAARRTA